MLQTIRVLVIAGATALATHCSKTESAKEDKVGLERARDTLEAPIDTLGKEQRHSPMAGEGLDPQLTLQLLLKSMQHDQSPQVRWSAINSLSLLRDTIAVPYFVRALQNESDSSVRAKIAEALRDFPDEEAVILALRNARATDPDKNVRTVAGYSLEQLDHTIPSTLRKAMKTGKPVLAGDIPKDFKGRFLGRTSVVAAKIYDTQHQVIVEYESDTIRFFGLDSSGMQLRDAFAPSCRSTRLRAADIDRDNRDEIVLIAGRIAQVIDHSEGKLVGTHVQMEESIDQCDFGDVDQNGFPELVALSHSPHQKDARRYNLTVWALSDTTFDLMWSKTTRWSRSVENAANCRLGRLSTSSDGKLLARVYAGRSDVSPPCYDLAQIDRLDYTIVRSTCDKYVTWGNPNDDNTLEIDPDGKSKGIAVFDLPKRKYTFYR